MTAKMPGDQSKTPNPAAGGGKDDKAPSASAAASGGAAAATGSANSITTAVVSASAGADPSRRRFKPTPIMQMDFSLPDPDIGTALEMLEYCRFAYKAYAQTCVYPMDPFYESHGKGTQARDGVMAQIHTRLKSTGRSRELDSGLLYRLDAVPNPREGVVYRGGTADQPYILFQPRPLDLDISSATGVDLTGKDVAGSLAKDAGGYRSCCHFQGNTGMTQSKPGLTWQTWLGAVIYDTLTGRIVVVFRGSRSGDGGRALKQALLHSQGNPDWVSDMNHLKGIEVPRFGNATLAAGFWQAYQSCKVSLAAAFVQARSGRPVSSIYFTGHSLGGALAQCAYIDFLADAAFLGSVADVPQMKTTVPITCYAVSAPAIVLGEASCKKVVEKILEKTKESPRIYHYFVKADTVHGGSQISTSAASVASSAVATMTHPGTSAVHLGTETALESTASFPEAHEPEAVREAMFAAFEKTKFEKLPPDPTFWPLLGLDVTGGKAPEVTLGACSLEDVLTALYRSTSARVALELAQLWQAAGTGSSSQASSVSKESSSDEIPYRLLSNLLGASSSGAGSDVLIDGPQFEIFHKLRLVFTDPAPKDAAPIKKALLEHRALLLALGAKSGPATSASIFVLLQYIAVLYCWFDRRG